MLKPGLSARISSPNTALLFLQPLSHWSVPSPPFPSLCLGLAGLAKSLSVARNGSSFFQNLFGVLSSQGDCLTPAKTPHPSVNYMNPFLTNERPLPVTS